MKEITEETFHQLRHMQFHIFLDEMMADFINDTGRLPSKTSLMTFAKWSNEQSQKGDASAVQSEE
jgi:hypothetical protein